VSIRPGVDAIIRIVAPRLLRAAASVARRGAMQIHE
jgi:hypothetical protein